MKKKFAAVWVILCLLLAGVLTGCGKDKVDAQTLLEEASANMNSKKSMEADMTMDFDGSIGGSVDGVEASLDMTMDMTLNVQSVVDGVSYMNGELKVSMLGMNVSTTIESYTEVVDGTEYTYSKTDDSGWEVAEAPADDDSDDMSMDLSQMIAEGAATATLAEGTQEVNGKEAYVVHVGISGDSLKDLMAVGMGSAGMDMEGVDFSSLTFGTDIYIDAKEKTVLKMDMDLAELGNALFGSMEEELSGMTVELTTFKLNMAFGGFDTVANLTIPDEVKSGATAGTLSDELTDGAGLFGDAETEPETEDAYEPDGPVTDANGNYILTDYIDEDLKAAIGAIDGYELYYGSDTMLSFQNEDYTDLTYSFWATDDVKADVSSLSYMQEDEDYTDIVEGDIQTKTVGSYEVSWFRLDYVFMGDSPCVDYYIWIEVKDGTKLICEVSAMGYQEAPNVDDSIVDQVFANVTLGQTAGTAAEVSL